MWHFQQFYGVITFTSVLRAATASFVALPFYLFSNILELWCGVRITSAVFKKINTSSARVWFVKAIYVSVGVDSSS